MEFVFYVQVLREAPSPSLSGKQILFLGGKLRVHKYD